MGVNFLECISMNNQECRAKPKIIDVNTDDPVFYPYSIKVNNCSGSSNNINNPVYMYYIYVSCNNVFLILLKNLTLKYLI